MPGGYIPTQETKQRECWKFDTRDVNSEFESRVSVRPSIQLPKPHQSLIQSIDVDDGGGLEELEIRDRRDI